MTNQAMLKLSGAAAAVVLMGLTQVGTAQAGVIGHMGWMRLVYNNTTHASHMSYDHRVVDLINRLEKRINNLQNTSTAANFTPGGRMAAASSAQVNPGGPMVPVTGSQVNPGGPMIPIFQPAVTDAAAYNQLAKTAQSFMHVLLMDKEDGNSTALATDVKHAKSILATLKASFTNSTDNREYVLVENLSAAQLSAVQVATKSLSTMVPAPIRVKPPMKTLF